MCVCVCVCTHIHTHTYPQFGNKSPIINFVGQKGLFMLCFFGGGLFKFYFVPDFSTLQINVLT